MRKTGVIGLGNMGSGLAKNLLAAGHETYVFDLDTTKVSAMQDLGGVAAQSPAEMAKLADTIFVMVMNGDQAKSVIFDENTGITANAPANLVIVITATIHSHEMREIDAQLAGIGIGLIDSPVSGGFPGAQSGTLALMASGEEETMQLVQTELAAISKITHHVGAVPGEGQMVKACLQSLIGSMFTATYEAAALAAKCGISGQVLHDVFASTGVGCGVVNGSLQNIMERKFKDTGSHIDTMHKDLSVSLALAQQKGVAMQSAGVAMQLFQAARSLRPDGDNQVVAKMLEDLAQAELHKDNTQ
ncbi:MAG: NAD(P)-dependent oxidoreductase [Pseudomonadota bacterium]